MAKNTKNSEAAKEPSFEEAMEQLEQIVERMESGDLPLEALLQTCEQGNALLQLCAGRLREAEEKIKLLTADKSGKVSAVPLDSPTEGPLPTASEDRDLF